MANLDGKLDEILNQLSAQKDDIRREVERQISGLKETVSESNQAVSLEVKKIRSEVDYSWRKEGNKIQFVFNSEVEEIVRQAGVSIDSGKPSRACELLSEVHEKLRHRNKLIKVADSSECGWETVRQYQSNPIASDSEDEAKLQKAESRAAKKRKERLTRFSRGGKKPRFSGGHVPTDSVTNFHGAGPSGIGNNWGQPARFTGPVGLQPRMGQSGLFRGNKGSCFGCGSFAHWRRDCPVSQQSAGSQRKQ